MTTVREGLLGPSYLYHRHLIEQSKDWSPDHIREYQEPRFRRRPRDMAMGLRRRRTIVATCDGIPAGTCRRSRTPVRTGGTSGQALRFRADTFARRQKERAYLFDIWSRVGYAPHDLRVVYRGDAGGGLIRFDRLENAWIVSPTATVEQELGDCGDGLRTLPPFFLHVYPSSLFTFIDLLGEDLFRSLSVQGVLAGQSVPGRVSRHGLRRSSVSGSPTGTGTVSTQS